jgi:outer membrane protein TolC
MLRRETKSAAVPASPVSTAARRAATLVITTITMALTTAATTSAVAAQRPDPMGRLVTEALQNNAGLAAARAVEARAAAEARAARASYLPSLVLESRYSEQNGTLNLGDVVNPAFAALNEVTGENRFPTDLDLTLPRRHETRLRLVQPVFNEAIRGNSALAGHRRDAQRWERRVVARRLAADVQAAWLDASSAHTAVGIWESTLERVRESERVAERLVAASQATPEVVWRARAERSEVEQQLAESSERAHAAVRALNRIVGRSLNDAVEIVSPDSVACLEIGITEYEANASAMERREELRQASSGLGAAQAAGRIATAAYLPSVALSLDYGYQGNDLGFSGDDDFVMASVVVSWSLFEGGRHGANRQAARADVDRSLAMRRQAEEMVRLDVQQAYESAVVARGAIDAAEARLASAERTFGLVRRKYEEGVASQIEFIDARVALTNAELNRVLTIYRYGVRWVELERAAALREIE